MGYLHTASQIGMTLISALLRGKLRVVSRPSDFPAAVGGVRSLASGTAWWILDDVDLAGDRLEALGPVTLFGLGAEAVALTSTGLTGGEAILTAPSAVQIRTMRINPPAGCVGVRLDGTGDPNPACDWTLVNFGPDGRAAELTNASNAIMDTIAFFGDGFHVYGTVGTVGISDTIFTPASGQTALRVDAGAMVTRRVRLDKCAMVIAAGATGAAVPSSAIPTSERFIQSQVDYSGAGTYLDGLDQTSDKSRFYECRGIPNSSRIGEMYWTGNTTPTVISVQNVFYPVAGIAIAGDENSRFSVAGAELTYTGALSFVFHVSAVVSITGTNNHVAGLAVFKNTTQASKVVSQTTLNGAGRAENVVVHAVVRMTTTDKISLHIRNQTAAANMTVGEMDTISRPAN